MSRSSENWDFVVNNYTDEILSELFRVLSDRKFFKKAIGYKEIGKNNETPHIQGYFRYCKKTTKNEILKNSGINDGILKDKVSFRIVRNLNATLNYIKKDGNCWIDTEKNENSLTIREIMFCNSFHTEKVKTFLKFMELSNVSQCFWDSLYDPYFDDIKQCNLCYPKISSYETI